MMSNFMRQSSALPDNWARLTPQEKREYRLNRLLNTEGINFVSPEAEKAYRVRVQRTVDVYNLREPDRVPVNLPVGNLPFRLYGINARTAMYDLEKALEAAAKFNEQYGEELEVYAMPYITPGRLLDILDYKIYAWPGHGIPENATGWQFIEGEYMTDDEYEDLIRDPSDFWIRKYLPRVFGVLEPLGLFQPFTNITENVHINQLMPLAMPPVQESLRKLLQAGEEFQKAASMTMKYAGQGPAHGYPIGMMGSFCKAPFDTLGDTLRGTANIMKDMFRRPKKLLKALDVITDISINAILTSPNIATMSVVTYPLHKGADGWMSREQFDTFYWPFLKRVMDAFIEEGLVQNLFAEGSFNTRLEYINEFPRGSVCWYFDRTDMEQAKKILGDRCCIQGNVPSSMLVTGEPKEVKEYCRWLIETCGKGGGYILSAGAVSDNPKLENIRAMMAAVREYGYYRK
jgi:hypothetical protein